MMLRMSNMLFCAFACLATGAALGATPLDRPSPPPRCADGVCVPHPQSFGYFQTRWRVWPGLEEAPMPTPATAAPARPQVLSPFEMPAPEKEDLKAPPLTKPAPERTIETPGGATPPAGKLPDTTTPGGPTPPLSTPPVGPQNLVPQPILPNSPFQPITPPQPAAPRPGTTPLGESKPLGDLDPPPSPRFSTPRLSQPVASPRIASQPAVAPLPPRAGSGFAGIRSTQRSEQDPPPPPPFAIGGASL